MSWLLGLRGLLSSPVALVVVGVLVGVGVFIALSQRKQRLQRLRDAQEVLEEVEGSERWRGKRVCVIVNPYGGRGKGAQIFKDVVRPMFDHAGIHIDKLGTYYFSI